jgi:putative N-acetyltransferase (TIGR04045 family)
MSTDVTDILTLLGDSATLARRPPFLIGQADAGEVAEYRRIRLAVFVAEQNIFRSDDLDELDSDPRTIVLVARDRAGRVVGGVRVAPVGPPPEVGWWTGSRLAVRTDSRGFAAVGHALVRAACARAEMEGALRFDATVQAARERLFNRLGWDRVRDVTVAGLPHVLMRWPINRLQHVATTSKGDIAPLLDGLRPGGAGFVGDDGVPVAGTDVVATCDAIVASMVERDPFWAGWCSVLVTVNDLAAMGAAPVGLLDCVAGRTPSQVSRILSGIRAASVAYGVPVLGGHTQVGGAPALSATAFGRTADPVPGGGGRPGDTLTLTVDLAGGWRPGYTGRQWDSTTTRSRAELSAMVGAVARARPAAAKDVSMAGIVGTLGMLAEASGCGAELDVAAVPRPLAASTGDWLTCFPGFGMLTAHRPGRTLTLDAGPATSAPCGRLVAGSGVTLVWPDGERTTAIAGPVTGLGAA